MTPLPDEPAHHRRFRVAWQAYQDPDTPKECLVECEQEMDDAQNVFNLMEFKDFKKTLSGMDEYQGEIKEKSNRQ